MQVDVHVSVSTPSPSLGGQAVTRSDKGLQFKAPAQLVDAGFPTADATFALTSVQDSNAINAQYLAPAADGLSKNRTNHIFFAYGQRYGPKRDQLFGPAGFASKLLAEVAKAAGAAPNGTQYQAVCFGVGVNESLVDFIDASNTDGVILETAHESPKPTKVEAPVIRTAADAAKTAASIADNVAAHFAEVAKPPSTPEGQALPPYVGNSVVFAVYRFDDGASFGNGIETNSVHAIALGDCDRPVLLGIEPKQQQQYDETQKHLGAVCGIVTAINCNRLRIPYGKTKFTSMLKRAYNAEKNSAVAAENEPTKTVFWAHVLDDEGSAEEAFHALCAVRKCVSLVAGVSVGNVTRDLAAEKWRVEQDIVELKDELAIAKAVHEYKPCIYEQAKPVANVSEEVRKRVESIKKKRQEARQKAEQEVERRAAEEAEKYIAQLEKESGKSMAGLEKELKDLQDKKTALEVERNKRREEHEKHLAKIDKKRSDEEKLADQLRAEVEALESELVAKRDLVNKKKSQLEAASEDQAKGRAAILKEREDIRATRARLYKQRSDERRKWLAEIEQANNRLLEQVQTLTDARKEAAAQGVKMNDEEEEDTAEAVREDINSIKEYLPKLISLEDVPADPDAVEAIRKQLEDYFEAEKGDYQEKLAAEKGRLQELQSQVEQYRSKLEEHHTKQKKEMLAEAMKKDNHLQSLVDQVIQYLQHGLRMYKVSSTGNVRYRFFFLTEDCKKICACELDENGMAVNRRKPTATIVLKDVTRLTLGTYSSSCVGFAGEALLREQRPVAMRDDGCSSAEMTHSITAQNLGKYNYRSFALELNTGKTLEVVCETDSDWEAWIVALKRLFNYRTDYEKRTTRAVREESAPIRWGKPLDIGRMAEAKQLTVDEAAICSETHIPPRQYLNAKNSIVAKSQSAFVTVYDVRVASKLDLLRAQQLYEFFVDHRIVPPPRR